MKTKRIEELKEIIKNAGKRADVYLNCTDGSWGACFDAHGGFKAQRELEKLEEEIERRKN